MPVQANCPIKYVRDGCFGCGARGRGEGLGDHRLLWDGGLHWRGGLGVGGRWVALPPPFVHILALCTSAAVGRSPVVAPAALQPQADALRLPPPPGLGAGAQGQEAQGQQLEQSGHVGFKTRMGWSG
jgi:hypothetical protein